jgi:N-methylhydantoinase A
VIRVGFDVGGTFTDVVTISSDGRLRSLKIANSATSTGTARDVAGFVRQAWAGTQGAGGDGYDWRHASTVLSNAVIEGSGPKVALITTQGFGDCLEIRDLARPNAFDVSWTRTPPLVPRHLRMTLREATRVRSAVRAYRPDLDRVDSLAQELQAQSVRCVAICFVNSYLDHANEDLVARHLRDKFPGFILSVSHELSGEVGEYERMSTAAVNAYLLPVIDSHLSALEAELSSVDGLLMMQSGGGVAEMAEARSRPVRFLESGPAAGVVASAAFCARLRLATVVALDMGGTTVKACIIENGEASVRDRAEVGDNNGLGSQRGQASGYPVRTPCFDIVELGAGGGSLASVEHGLLRVGPCSAGAVPGPACYARGGQAPTVTDANVVLGLLNPQALAAGTFPIRSELAETAVAGLTADLDCTVTEAAWGIRRLANATMVRAIRSVTIERGRDPRECDLLASGGSGPLHAAHLAEAMGITRVVVPPYAGVLSALGLLVAPTRSEAAQSVRPIALPGPAHDALAPAAAALRDTIGVAMSRVPAANREAVAVRPFVHLRYRQQTEAMRIPVGSPDRLMAEAASLTAGFEAAHLLKYGYQRADDTIELVQVSATVSVDDADFPQISASDLESTTAPETKRSVYWGPERGWVETPVLGGRAALLSQDLAGPAVIEEADTSIAVPLGWMVSLGEAGVLILSRLETEADCEGEQGS